MIEGVATVGVLRVSDEPEVSFSIRYYVFAITVFETRLLLVRAVTVFLLYARFVSAHRKCCLARRVHDYIAVTPQDWSKRHAFI